MSETLGAEALVPTNKGSLEQNRTEVGDQESEEAAWQSRDNQLCRQLAVCLWWLCPHLSFPSSKMKEAWWEKHVYDVSLCVLPYTEFTEGILLPALLVMLFPHQPFLASTFFH